MCFTVDFNFDCVALISCKDTRITDQTLIWQWAMAVYRLPITLVRPSSAVGLIVSLWGWMSVVAMSIHTLFTSLLEAKPVGQARINVSCSEDNLSHNLLTIHSAPSWSTQNLISWIHWLGGYHYVRFQGVSHPWYKHMSAPTRGPLVWRQSCHGDDS